MPNPGVTLRAPQVADAASIWKLLPEVGNLERNSAYAYLLLCSHFAATSLVAVCEREIAGFVLAYRPPTEPTSLFVWQVGVAPAARGEGLGTRMLDGVLALPGCKGVSHLTATVSPDNLPSLALFRGYARRRGVACELGRGYPATLFPAPHPDEDLLRIGPLVQKGRT
ncbi:MAG TPA: diaminobutyrate acetyltransferase [Gemmatimonadaceae bacterium]|nr:diaminobutyrate acetyltransferase [Gemmatimonadaceae bacterium]